MNAVSEPIVAAIREVDRERERLDGLWSDLVRAALVADPSLEADVLAADNGRAAEVLSLHPERPTVSVSVVEDRKQYGPGKATLAKVSVACSKVSEPFTVAELAEEVDLSNGSLRDALREMVRVGALAHNGRGIKGDPIRYTVRDVDLMHDYAMGV